MYIPFSFLFLLISTVQWFPELVKGAEKSNMFSINSVSGPFKLILRNVEACPASVRGKNVFRLTGTIGKMKEYRDVRFNGNFQTLEKFEDDISLHAHVASWSVVGWVPNAFNIKLEQLCSTMNTVFRDAVNFVEDHEINKQRLCPREVGNFTVKAVPTVYNMKNWIPFQYGRWRADLQYFRGEERLGCNRAILETVPILDDI